MEFKGTKGKWQHCNSNGCKTIFVKGVKGQRRKEICDTVGRGEIEDFANAQLIIKAPEMLEMLKESLDTFTCNDSSDRDLKSRIEQLIKSATTI